MTLFASPTVTVSRGQYVFGILVLAGMMIHAKPRYHLPHVVFCLLGRCLSLQRLDRSKHKEFGSNAVHALIHGKITPMNSVTVRNLVLLQKYLAVTMTSVAGRVANPESLTTVPVEAFLEQVACKPTPEAVAGAAAKLRKHKVLTLADALNISFEDLDDMVRVRDKAVREVLADMRMYLREVSQREPLEGMDWDAAGMRVACWQWPDWLCTD